MVLGTWYSDFGNVKAKCSLDLLQPGPWYLVMGFRERYSKLPSLPTLVWSSVLGTLLSGISKQTALLKYFSLVFGTWYWALGKVAPNCSLF
jgi:hypothetical protein